MSAIVFDVIAIVAVYACVVLAIIAGRRAQPWLAAPSVVAIFAVIAVGIAYPGSPPAPVVGALLATGIALLGVVAGSPLVAIVLLLATRGTVSLGTHGGILVDEGNPPAAQREILRGGATIGYLERLALIGSVLAGQAAAVAVIVAVKGLGRYSELENGQARERFIIGTLASLIWAGACAGAVLLSW